MAINEGRQNRRITENRSGKESSAQTIRKSAVYSRITVTLPTFAILLLRRFAKRRNENGGGAENVSTVLESWILSLFSARELTRAGKESPEFTRTADAWIRWEAQERAAGRRPTAKRVKP